MKCKFVTFGQIFIYGGHIYMKVGSIREYNCISLENGFPYITNDEYEVDLVTKVSFHNGRVFVEV